MSESLLRLRHPDLNSLYTVWLLARNGNTLPPVTLANAEALSAWQDRLLILDLSPPSNSVTVSHCGAALASSWARDEALAKATRSVALARHPLVTERANRSPFGEVVLFLPFGSDDALVDRVVIAAYPPRPKVERIK